MICNFERAQPDRESLLYHDDLEIFFHEFAHVMHTICSSCDYIKFSGTAVEKDFVEMPALMLDNWVWNKKVLKRISKHYQKTNEILPEKLIDEKIKSRNLN